MSLDAAIGVPAPGTLVAGKYRIRDILGRGGMGCVVEAEHLLLRKSVAIKFLREQSDGVVRGRLFREARAAQSISSEHVVRVFEVGVQDDSAYIVMELLEGCDLAERVAQNGPLPVPEAVDCVIEACIAVGEAHALGIIHRDLKPSNLFLARTATTELVKVLDFGISKLRQGDSEQDCEETNQNAMLGTPYYMSPEQLRNPAKIDERTDVWALAVTLHYLLCGEHPFPGATAGEVTATIFTDEPREPRPPEWAVPNALCRAIRAALAKRPEERTRNVAELVAKLSPFASRRGRLAAERVSTMKSSAPAAVRGDASRAGAQRDLDSGLSSTLPETQPSSSRAPPAAVHGDRQQRVRRVLPLALVLVGAATIVWAGMRSNAGTHTAPAKHGANTTTVRSAERPADNAVQAPPPSKAAPTGSATNAMPAANSHHAAPHPRSTLPAKRRAHRPAAAPVLRTPADPPRLDIDGVPIVE